MRIAWPERRSRWLASLAPIIFPTMSLLFVLAVGCCARPANAQIVHVEARDPFSGWVRATLDKRPPYRSGIVTRDNGDIVPYVVGRSFGLDCMTVDLRVEMAAGERIVLDLRRSSPAPWKLAPLPDVLAYYRGLPECAGVPLALQTIQGGRAVVQDGAAVVTHWRGRIAPMWCVDLWVLLFPDDPYVAFGEARLTCSNPLVPDVRATVPEGMRLRFGDAAVHVLGAGEGAPLAAAGTVFADGQARASPVAFVWTRHMPFGSTWRAVHERRVQAVGDVTLWPEGNPLLPPSFNSAAWADARAAAAASLLHQFAPMVVAGYPAAMICGANATSGDTGEQQEQVFTCAEPLAHERARQIIELSALKYANRPCHHLEPDGSLLNHLGHTSPRLVLWDMRAHWSASVSPDRLGKTTGIAAWDCSGWWGADVEHALYSTLAAGARLTGSYDMQTELATIGRNYLFQWTFTPGLSTSQPFAARAIGWEGNLCAHLWRTLEDRDLAARVRQRWLDRFDFVIEPALNAGDVRDRGGVWTTHTDSQLGPGTRWQPWQQAVGADGLDRAGMVFGRPEARTLALRAAKTVVEAFSWDGSRWIIRDNIRLDGPQDASTGTYPLYGVPLAPQVVLRHEPEHERARAVWTQLRAAMSLDKHFRWIVPSATVDR